MKLLWLDARYPEQPFPDPASALDEPNGLVAAGGDLSVTRLLNAYRQGIFPWFNPGEPILWWSPHPRTVFYPDRMHISRSLRRAMNRKDYAVTLDKAFVDVIESCSRPRRNQHGTWLSDEMIAAYAALHLAGYAHSLEVWRNHQLIGGIYGVVLGRIFFGESMFSRADNASKIALMTLANQLSAWQFDMIDGQVASPHLFQLGAIEISREDFQHQLQDSLQKQSFIGKWELEIDAPGSNEHLPIE